MARANHGASVKDDDTYEALREDGASKQKAARIANAQANHSQHHSPGAARSPPLMTSGSKDELYPSAPGTRHRRGRLQHGQG